MKQLPFGVYPVVLTPFDSDLRIDFGAYRALIEWYLGRGADGLFAVCLSGEMFQLTPAERLKLAEVTLEATAGRVPVVACAGIESDPAAQRESIRAMASLPVAAVVQPLGCMVGPEESDALIPDRFRRLLDAAGDTPVGAYECPVPYHRLFPDDMPAKLAAVCGGRLVFFKDTCCDGARLARRLESLRGSGLSLFNANLTTLPGSIRAGGAGYCGISANFYPELLKKLCELVRQGEPAARELEEYFLLVQRHVEFKYPSCAKAFVGLELAGFPVHSRMNPQQLSPEELLQLKVFHKTVVKWGETLQICCPV